MSERLEGAIRRLDPDGGFGLIRVRNRRNHWFPLSEAPQGLAIADIVTFRSLPPKGKLPIAADIELKQDATVAA